MTLSDPDELLRAKLNLETATIAWKELQRHFAGGWLLAVAPELDLVDVALQITSDNKATVEHWLEAGKLAKVNDSQAQHWHGGDATLWAVVVRPWILVQDKSAG